MQVTMEQQMAELVASRLPELDEVEAAFVRTTCGGSKSVTLEYEDARSWMLAQCEREPPPQYSCQ